MQLSLVATITGLLLAAQVVQPGPVRAAVAPAVVEPAGVVIAAPLCSSLYQYAFNDLNNWRRSRGLPAYQFDQRLATAACGHTARLWDYNPWSGCPNAHQCPGEPDPGTRMRNAGATFTYWGENVGFRWATPSQDPYAAIRAIHTSFMAEGPGGGHYQNMMSTRFQRVGIGVVSDQQRLWLTEDFAG
jgi:uncharacterized protein YkwD